MSSETRQHLHFVSWNTRGIKDTANVPNKISDLLDVLNNIQAEIVFIQETHVGPGSEDSVEKTFLERGWKEVFFTVYSPRSKGVAILIRNDVEFEYICHDEDHSGSYIVLFCRLYGELYTLVNVYNHKEERTLLGRLKEYLQETAEGVLVVGGDFNTVLDPNFDRLSSAHHAELLAVRRILEDFTSSLNLRDTWAELHPTDIDFTRREWSSNSRLDMFFMPEDTRERVISCEINTTSQISDHDPVVLTLLRIQQQTDNKIPNVASMLVEYGYDGKPHRTPENISGAEILSAIKSFTDSGIIRPDELTVDDYKLFRCPMTEILKILYNMMLNSNIVPSLFKESVCTQNIRTFNVDYLIFSLILARRLKVCITHFEQQKKPNLELNLWVSFAGDPKEIKIKWSFLERCLTSLKPISPPPTRDFSILKSLLPEDSSGREFRCLQQGCYLTNPILTLVLMQLKDQIVRSNEMASVCHFRNALFIQTEINRFQEIRELVMQFERDSGIKLEIPL